MPQTTVPPSAPLEIVIPDCCNIGVIFRCLLAVNGVVFAAVLFRSSSLLPGVQDFVELSILLEPACLSTLLVLCALRRIIRTIRPWGQRIVCALVPAAVTGLILRFILSNELIFTNFSQRTTREGMLIAALFGIVLQHYFEIRTRAFSPALSEARLQALQARIRPHFLYNSLNAVLSLIRTEPALAEATLEDLADLFRVLMRDARDITSLEDEIKLCKQYLSIEQIRLGPRLHVEWEMGNVTDAVLRKAKIPALLLQPILENAVHYGVEPVSEPVVIKVKLSRSIDRIDMVVTNPVPDPGQREIVASLGNRMALDNIRQRLALLYDVEAKLSTELKGGFFEVKLHIPYSKDAR